MYACVIVELMDVCMKYIWTGHQHRTSGYVCVVLKALAAVVDCADGRYLLTSYRTLIWMIIKAVALLTRR